MEKVFKTLGIVATAAVLLASCSKQEGLSQKDDLSYIRVNAGSELSTKTVLGSDGKVTWSESGEKLEVLQVAGTETKASISSEGTTSDNGQTMTFDVSFDSSKEESFDYYALYPSSAYVTSSNTNVEKLKVVLESAQYPTESSLGAGADLLIAKPVTGLTSQPEQIDFQFARIVSVGKMKIADLNSTENVKSVTFTAPNKTLAGRSYVDLFTGYVTEYGYYGKSESIALSYADKTIAANGMTAYFTCWPCTFATGDTFTVKVETENKTFTKEVTITSDDALAFKEGRSSSFTVSFSDIEGEDTTIYTKLAELNKAIIAAGKDGMDFKLDLASAAEVTKVCSDDKTTYIQDATGAIMLYGKPLTNYLKNGAEKTTIKGVVTGTGAVFNGLPEVTDIDFSKATIAQDGTGIYTEATIAEILADFNKYLNCKVKLTDVTVADAFSQSDKNGKFSQGDSEIAIYVKNTSEKFSFTALTTGDVVCYPALYNTTNQVYFWGKDDFTVKAIGTEISLKSSYTVNVGETVSLAATSTSTATLKYTSADETIATVSEDGTVTGVKEGTVKITASVDAVEGYTAASATTIITVNPAGSVVTKVFEFLYTNSLTSDITTAIAATSDVLKNYFTEATNVYEGKNGYLKLGTSSKTGSLTTKSIDLSKAFTVSIKVKKFPNDKDTGTVNVECGNQKREITPDADGAVESLDFTAETATSQIKISTSSKRAYVTDIVVTYK